MSLSVINIIIVCVGAYALLRGFRVGMVGQITGFLGLAFGVVAAHVFQAQAREVVLAIAPGLKQNFMGGFISSVIASASIYTIVYLLFKVLSGVLRSALSVLHVGMLNSLLGAAFNLLKYMVVVSIVLNIVICINPRSKMVKSADADDGNLVEVVLLLAPALLGSEDVTDLYHKLQLLDAKKISLNNTARQYVSQYITLNTRVSAQAQPLAAETPIHAHKIC